MTKALRDVVTHSIHEEALADTFYVEKDTCKTHLCDVTKTLVNKEKTTKIENILTNPEKMTGFP